MQTRILCALIAMAVAGSAVAQAVPPPPAAGTPPAPLAGALPPPPPGCGGNGAIPPPPPPPAPANDASLAKSLGIGSSQASQVQRVFERQAAQAQRLDQQRRDLDAQTCKDLRGILGDQGMARWAAATPPPPPPPGREPFGPGRGPAGVTPPAPVPAPGN